MYYNKFDHERPLTTARTVGGVARAGRGGVALSPGGRAGGVGRPATPPTARPVTCREFALEKLPESRVPCRCVKVHMKRLKLDIHYKIGGQT
ncbi:hypothetical protein EVAR_90532_1 [Eumeta japonica]|uniref:Uncharacterized protein n=1 Tax=Eumeta variegata TaxID=151549 RepID=A0A4C1XYQ6_EUMVA|nr:hypothetical protein EVAR_90532_1 [Eumeta japonica]